MNSSAGYLYSEACQTCSWQLSSSVSSRRACLKTELLSVSVESSVGVSVGVSADMSAGVSADISVGVSVDISVGASVGASVDISVDISVDVSVDVSVGVSVGVSTAVSLAVGEGLLARIGLDWLVDPMWGFGTAHDSTCVFSELWEKLSLSRAEYNVKYEIWNVYDGKTQTKGKKW